MSGLPLTYAAVFRLMVPAIALWCTLSSLEMLAVLPAFRPTRRALGRDIAVLRRGRLRRPPWTWLSLPRVSTTIALTRLAAGICLPFADPAIAAVLLIVIGGCTVALSIATEGSDGADKIALIACAAATLVDGGLLSNDRSLCLAGVAWATGQLTIAYVTSGAAKLVRPFWRDGSALAAAMTSYQSGHPIVARVVRNRSAALVLAWSLMFLEVLFPLALIAPAPVALAILIVFAIFHFSTAAFMGLSTYPWAFMATYPCVFMANALIRCAFGLPT